MMNNKALQIGAIHCLQSVFYTIRLHAVLNVLPNPATNSIIRLLSVSFIIGRLRPIS